MYSFSLAFDRKEPELATLASYLMANISLESSLHQTSPPLQKCYIPSSPTPPTFFFPGLQRNHDTATLLISPPPSVWMSPATFESMLEPSRPSLPFMWRPWLHGAMGHLGPHRAEENVAGVMIEAGKGNGSLEVGHIHI
mmetsp:Transcript_7145/g.15491  ORF Transcript_7145/g.15491 Transcript_7145/m.15491 type:complete len:139 (+) Transcript_7145:299-715(+)